MPRAENTGDGVILALLRRTPEELLDAARTDEAKRTRTAVEALCGLLRCVINSHAGNLSAVARDLGLSEGRVVMAAVERFGLRGWLEENYPDPRRAPAKRRR